MADDMGSISLVIDISDGDLADEREEVRTVYTNRIPPEYHGGGVAMAEFFGCVPRIPSAKGACTTFCTENWRLVFFFMNGGRSGRR